jgi:hypothetical protein
MAALRHPNILGFMGVVTAPPCLVLEYCPRGSLYDVLREARESPSGDVAHSMDWTRRLQMVRSLALALAPTYSRRSHGSAPPSHPSIRASPWHGGLVLGSRADAFPK